MHQWVLLRICGYDIYILEAFVEDISQPVSSSRSPLRLLPARQPLLADSSIRAVKPAGQHNTVTPSRNQIIHPVKHNQILLAV